MINERNSSDRGRGRAAACGGFTLVELMVAIAVLAVLLALAVPNFNDASLSARLNGFASSLVASAQVARSEAIKRNTTITLCRSANGTSCSGSGGWQQGWIVMAGATTLPTTDDVVLHVQQGLPPEFSITGGDVTFPGTVVGTTPTTLTVCRKTPLGKEERVVTISGTGSAYVTIATTGTCS